MTNDWRRVDTQQRRTLDACDRLTLQDRRQVAAGLREGLTYAAIGRRIGRPTSTVTREVVRNGGPRGYHAEAAHQVSARHERQRRTTALTTSPGMADLGGRDARLVDEVGAQSVELMIQAGLPQMMAKVLAALFTTDSGSLTSAELVRRLHVSPASISKAIGYLETRHSSNANATPTVAPNATSSTTTWCSDPSWPARATKPGSPRPARPEPRNWVATTRAGARLENTSQFLLHVVDDLVRSTEHWHKIYSTGPRKASAID